jgi:CheY-like chemotaxis protein
MTGNILVIDDDPDLRQTLQLLLADQGYGVTAVANGQAGLDQLRKGPRPILILLDLMMPEMNGWEFLEYASADSTLGSVPVVIMTARPAVEPLPPSAADVLRKPFDFAKLLSTIARCAQPPS